MTSLALLEAWHLDMLPVHIVPARRARSVPTWRAELVAVRPALRVTTGNLPPTPPARVHPVAAVPHARGGLGWRADEEFRRIERTDSSDLPGGRRDSAHRGRRVGGAGPGAQSLCRAKRSLPTNRVYTSDAGGGPAEMPTPTVSDCAAQPMHPRTRQDRRRHRRRERAWHTCATPSLLVSDCGGARPVRNNGPRIGYQLPVAMRLPVVGSGGFPEGCRCLYGPDARHRHRLSPNVLYLNPLKTIALPPVSLLLSLAVATDPHGTDVAVRIVP
jgi:hypothetical protein